MTKQKYFFPIPVTLEFGGRCFFFTSTRTAVAMVKRGWKYASTALRLTHSIDMTIHWDKKVTRLRNPYQISTSDK